MSVSETRAPGAFALLVLTCALAHGQTPAAPKEEILPATPKAGLPAADPVAAATVRDLAAKARAGRAAAEPGSAAAAGGASVLAQPVSPAAPIPLAAQRAAKTDFDPRLVSIVGGRGRERVELALDGVVYTVSMLYPALGTTGWRLTSVNADNASVRIAKHSEKASSPAMVIGFSRREPDTEPAADRQAARMAPAVPFGAPPFQR
jgi:hypothetical protein